MGWWKERRERREAAKAARAPASARELAPSGTSVGADPAQSLAMPAPRHSFSTPAVNLGDYFYRVAPDSYLFPAMYYDTEMTRLLAASSWSWAAITGNSRAMASLPVVVQERRGDRWVNAPSNHPLWKWTDDPLGPDEDLPFWSWSQLFYTLCVHRYVAGNAYMIPQIVNGDVYSVALILNPLGVRAEEQCGTHAPTKYIMTGGGALGCSGVPTEWAPRDIVNIMAPNPSSYWKGLSPLSVAMRPVQTDSTAAERQNANLKNKVAPGMIVSVESQSGMPGVNSTQADAMLQQLQDGYQRAECDGTPWIIGGAAKIQPPMGANELQYFDTRAFARDEILAVIGMPPTVAGVLDKAILNNVKVLTVNWWGQYLFPVLGETYAAMNAQLIRPHYGRDTRLWYDLSDTNIALQLLSARLDVAAQFQQLGYSTNDIATRLDLGMEPRDYLNLPNHDLIRAGRLGDLAPIVDALKDNAAASETSQSTDPEPSPDPDPET
jgi:phage portal protein BeeE